MCSAERGLGAAAAVRFPLDQRGEAGVRGESDACNTHFRFEFFSADELPLTFLNLSLCSGRGNPSASFLHAAVLS